MRKKLYLLLFIFITLSSPVFANDLYYCGGYNSSYTYDAKTFEQQFLNKTSEQVCTYGSSIDQMCVKMYNRNLADYKAGKCKLISKQTYEKLKQAKIQRNPQLFNQILNENK